jgi:hypothetical protein
MQGLAIGIRDRCFWTPKKCSANLNAARTKRERGSYTATVRDATSRDHGNAYGVHHLRNESHRADQPGATARGKSSTMAARLDSPSMASTLCSLRLMRGVL